MYAKKTTVVTIAALGLLFLGGMQPRPAAADEPSPRWRSFILRLPFDATFEDCPDVTSEESLFLLTHAGQRHNPADNPDAVGFGVNDSGSEHHVEKFDGTTWYFGGYVTHVTLTGCQSYELLWKDGVPPPGAIAETGPGGTVVIEHYWVRLLGTGEGDNTNGNWTAENIPTLNSFPFCYGVGLFSR